MIKEGFTKAKLKAFELKNPKGQMFTKEDLAKYVNAFGEVLDGKKSAIGPNYVVRGNQKNYVQFMNFNLPRNVDSVYFEDVAAKAILFRTAERKYGVKPNSIGDMRYITVPYTLSYLSARLERPLDLYRIWKAQAISENLQELLYNLMVQIESFIKGNAPGSLYSEWAKKDECWQEVKKQNFQLPLEMIKSDLTDPRNPTTRKILTEEEASHSEVQAEYEKVKSVPAAVWSKIEEWGRATGLLTVQQQSVAWNLAGRIRNKNKITDYERTAGIRIMDTVIEQAPEILFDIEELATEPPDQEKVTMDLIIRMTDWDRIHKKLKPHYYQHMMNIVNGKSPLRDQSKRIVLLNLETLKKYGFME